MVEPYPGTTRPTTNPAAMSEGLPPRRRAVSNGISTAYVSTAILALLLLAPELSICQNSRISEIRFQPSYLVNGVFRYRMVSGKTEVGEVKATITRDAASGTIQILESTSGLFERSTFLTVRDDSTLRPVTSHTVIAKDARFQEIRLQYSDGHIRGKLEQPPAFGGDRIIDTAQEPGTTDYYLVYYLIRATPLSLGRTLSYLFYDAHEDKIQAARIWVAKIEVVKVPAGSFECYRVVTMAGNRRAILDLEVDFPHRLIKQTIPALDLAYELTQSTDLQEASTLNLQPARRNR